VLGRQTNLGGFGETPQFLKVAPDPKAASIWIDLREHGVSLRSIGEADERRAAMDTFRNRVLVVPEGRGRVVLGEQGRIDLELPPILVDRRCAQEGKPEARIVLHARSIERLRRFAKPS
jgi:hypothetical protein